MLHAMASLSVLAQSNRPVIVLKLSGSTMASFQLMSKERDGRFKEFSSAPFISNGQTTFLDFPSSNGGREMLLRANFKKTGDSSLVPMEWPLLLLNQMVTVELNFDSLRQGLNPRLTEVLAINKYRNIFDQRLLEYNTTIEALNSLSQRKNYYRSQFFKQVIEEKKILKSQYQQWLKAFSEKNLQKILSNYTWVKNLPEPVEELRTDAAIERWTSKWMEGLDKFDTTYIQLFEFEARLDHCINAVFANASTEKERDVLLLKVSNSLLHQFQMAHPVLRSYIGDYFFRGFGTLHLNEGFELLKEVVFHPASTSIYKTALLQKLNSLIILQIGKPVPDIVLSGADHKKLSELMPKEGSTLLFFGSATCSHCLGFIEELKQWHQQATISSLLQVMAISIDKEEQEKKLWQELLQHEKKWMVATTSQGVYSEEAVAFGVLSTPSIFLIENNSRKLIAVPDDLTQLKKNFQQ